MELVTTVRVRPLGSKSIVRAMQGDTADKKKESKEKDKTESTTKDKNSKDKDKDLPSGETKETGEPSSSGNNSPSKSAAVSPVRRSFDKQSKDGKKTNPFRDSKEFLRISKDNKNDVYDVFDGVRGDTEEDIVEMCSGWVMIPIVAALRDPVRKKKIEMYGGTPFAVLKINKKEVPKRPGDTIPTILHTYISYLPYPFSGCIFLSSFPPSFFAIPMETTRSMERCEAIVWSGPNSIENGNHHDFSRSLHLDQ